MAKLGSNQKETQGSRRAWDEQDTSKTAQLYTHDGKQKTRGREGPSTRASSLSGKRGASQICTFVYRSPHHSALPGKSGAAVGRPGAALADQLSIYFHSLQTKPHLLSQALALTASVSSSEG